MRMLLAALALLFVVAAASSTPARRSSSRWPAAWKVAPSAEVEREIRDAAADLGVPVLLLLALAYVETGGSFKTGERGRLHGGNSARFAASFTGYQGRAIPNSSIKWGDKFSAADWRPYGLMQLMPYNLWGVTVAADAPLAAGFEVRANVRAAARFLKTAYATGGTWLAAIKAYNSKPQFRALVLDQYRALGGNPAALGGATS